MDLESLGSWPPTLYICPKTKFPGTAPNRRIWDRYFYDWCCNGGSMLCPGRTGGKLQMKRSSLRDNQPVEVGDFGIGALSINLEESIEYTSSKWKQYQIMLTCNRLDLESLAILTYYAQKLPGRWSLNGTDAECCTLRCFQRSKGHITVAQLFENKCKYCSLGGLQRWYLGTWTPLRSLLGDKRISLKGKVVGCWKFVAAN